MTQYGDDDEGDLCLLGDDRTLGEDESDSDDPEDGSADFEQDPSDQELAQLEAVSSQETLRRPFVDPAEERDLILRAKQEMESGARNQVALGKLLTLHAPFCWKWVHHWHKRNPEIETSDLFQEAQMGLREGIKRYDPSRGVKLITYAGWGINSHLQRYIALHRTVCVLPANVNPPDLAALRLYRSFLAERHRLKGDAPLSPEERREVFQRTGRWPHALEQIIQTWYGRSLSLNAPVVDGEDLTYLDRLSDGPFASPDAEACRESQRRMIENLIVRSGLNPREGDILRARFGLNPAEEPETLEALGQRFGLTRERIRQIEAKAMAALREAAGRMHQEAPRSLQDLSYPPSAPHQPSQPKENSFMTQSLNRPGAPPVEISVSRLAQREGLTGIGVSIIYELPGATLARWVQDHNAPLAIFSFQGARRIRGIFVSPTAAKELTGQDGRASNPDYLGKLRTHLVDLLDRLERKGAVFFSNFANEDDGPVLALIPATPKMIGKVKAYYKLTEALRAAAQEEPQPGVSDAGDSKPVAVEAQAQRPESEDAPEVKPEQTAKPEQEPEEAPVSPVCERQDGADSIPSAAVPAEPAATLAPQTPTPVETLPFPVPVDTKPAVRTEDACVYDLSAPRDPAAVLAVFSRAVKGVQESGAPVQIQYPGGSVLVAQDEGFVRYLEQRAPEDGQVLGETEDPLPSHLDPRSRGDVGICRGFAFAAAGGSSVVSVDRAAPVAMTGNPHHWEAYRTMREVLAWGLGSG